MYVLVLESLTYDYMYFVLISVNLWRLLARNIVDGGKSE